jgi:hypothetical protein
MWKMEAGFFLEAAVSVTIHQINHIIAILRVYKTCILKQNKTLLVMDVK